MIFYEIITHDLRKPMCKRVEERKHCGPYRWRPSKTGTGRGFYMAEGLKVDQAGSTFDLRLEPARNFLPFGSRLSRIDGYFYSVAMDRDECLIPIVARLPNKRGFLAGWTMGDGMMSAIDGDVCEDGYNAALAAYDMAERNAEGMIESEERADDPDLMDHEAYYQFRSEDGEPYGMFEVLVNPAGMVWWRACFPGCLPDSDMIGPFPSIDEAVRDAREN